MTHTANNGVYFGRFQPIHLEHLKRICEIKETYPNVKLNLGIADWRGTRTKSNFLYTEEALTIAKLSLKDLGLDDVGVFGVPLGPQIDLKSSIRMFANDHGIKYVFSGSDKTLAASRELSVRELEFTVVDLNDDESGIRATDIRKSIKEGTELWRERLTPSAGAYVGGMLQQLNHRLIFLPDGQKRPWAENELIGKPNQERR